MIISSNRLVYIPPAGVWNFLLDFENSSLEIYSCSRNTTVWNSCHCMCACALLLISPVMNNIALTNLLPTCVCVTCCAQDRADMEKCVVLSIAPSMGGRVKMREQSQDRDAAWHGITELEQQTVGSNLTNYLWTLMRGEANQPVPYRLWG